MTVRYSERYDALYDDEDMLWIDGKCSDPECDYCADRPEFPELDSNDRVVYNAKF